MNFTVWGGGGVQRRIILKSLEYKIYGKGIRNILITLLYLKADVVEFKQEDLFKNISIFSLESTFHYCT